MISRLLPATLLSLGLVLTGCATFDKTELGIIRGSGVSGRVYNKMQDSRPLRPEDVIELTRRHVPERYIVRQIEDVGVDYALSREDFKRLQNANVSRGVVDALIAASAEFSERHAPSRHHVYFGDPFYYPYSYPYDYDPYSYGWPYYGGAAFGIEFSGGHDCHYGHHHHH